MKRLALILCAMLVLAVLGTSAFAKKGGIPNGKGYGRGGRHGSAQPTPGLVQTNSDEEDGDEDQTIDEPADEDTANEVDDDEDDQDDQDAEDADDGAEIEDSDDEGEQGQNGKETPKDPADYHGLNKQGKRRHLYLYQKDPATWETLVGGAWGKLTFTPSGDEFCFVFNGHNLQPGTSYTLVYYLDDHCPSTVVCIGKGTANNGGQLHIAGCADTGDIPMEGDENAYKGGGKIWLVVSEDVQCSEEGSQMVVWHPENYLFEYNLITFDDTSDDTEEGGQEAEEEGAEEGEP